MGEDILRAIIDDGLVAVIRAESGEQALRIVEAVREGGIRAIEITMTVPGAVEIIRELCSRFDDLLIGAGTVLDGSSARACIGAGAKFIVSPALVREVIEVCQSQGVPVIPGVMTVTEAVEAMKLGVRVLKLFPAEVVGPSFIRAMKGPLPQAQFLPTGGVSLANVQEWIKAGAVAVGTGGDLTRGALVGDYPSVTRAAQEFVALVREARGGR